MPVKERKITFGQYTGTVFSKLPTKYLKWLYGQPFFRYSRLDCHLHVLQYIKENADERGIILEEEIERIPDDFMGDIQTKDEPTP